MSADAAVQSEIVYCRVCSYVIPGTARKCTKCSSWQRGVMAYVPITDSSLSVLLALISVLTVIVPPIFRSLGAESLTRVAIVTGEANKDLKVTISNVGQRPTVLRSYRVEFVGSKLLPAQTLFARNDESALVMPEKDATAHLHGALKVPLPDTLEHRQEIADWIATGTVTLTACVRESGAGVVKADMLAAAGSCESKGLVTRTDSVAAIQLKDWIEGLVQWNKPNSSDSQ